jgi:hypothetical protein
MKRALGGFAALGLLGALAACVPIKPPPPPPQGGVIMYGDSLLEASGPYVRSTTQLRGFGGTALCDWLDNIEAAAGNERPDLIVVEFVGNNLTPCMSGYTTAAQIGAKYTADAAELKQRVDVPILWVGPPLFRSGPPPTWGLFDAEPRFVDAGQAVLDGGAYTDTLPCLPDEGPAQGCVSGLISVRAADGAHFGTSAPGYSSGARRFADAIDAATDD